MTTFNPQAHLIEIKSGSFPNQTVKQYLPVAARIMWFRSDCPNGTITTEIISLDKEAENTAIKWVDKKRVEVVLKGEAIVRATVTDGKGGSATAMKMESKADFGDYLEKAETGAIGRALASMGYGTQWVGMEFDEGARIVDTPQERPIQATPTAKVVALPEFKQLDNVPAMATEAQLEAIEKLCKIKGVVLSEDPKSMSIQTAGNLIGSLQKREKRTPATMGQVETIEGLQQRLDLPTDRATLEKMSFEDAAKLKDELKSQYNAKIIAEKEPMGFQQRKTTVKRDMMDARLNGSRNFKEQCLLNN